MADDEKQQVDDAGTDEAVAEEQPEDKQLAQEQEMERFADDAGGPRRRRGRLRGAGAGARRPAQGLLDPGRRPEGDATPTAGTPGEKRDHGGEDAIEVIDVVKQFGRTRILNGLNLGLPGRPDLDGARARRVPARAC